jgi:hypothetical protein
VEVGTLLNPTTPLVGFTSSSSSALLPQDRLFGSATINGLLSTAGVALTAAVVMGRTSGGVVVIASGPSWTTVGETDRIGVGAGVGGMELVINLEVDVGILVGAVEKGRVAGLEREVLVDEELERFAAGFIGLDNCPKSLVSSAVIVKSKESDSPDKGDKLSCQSPAHKHNRNKAKEVEEIPADSRPHRLVLGFVWVYCY